MDILEKINAYILSHPVIAENIELAFRIKFWLLLILAIYFMSLPYREYKKNLMKQKEDAKKDTNFLA